MNNSISQSLREYYQLEAHSVDDKIEAVRATQEDVQILRCSYNSPLMLVSGIAYAPSGEPMGNCSRSRRSCPAPASKHQLRPGNMVPGCDEVLKEEDQNVQNECLSGPCKDLGRA